MSVATNILFESQGDSKPLFSNQLDLVTALLNDPNTPYFVRNNEVEKYQKAQTRLKTYISQLLSSSTSRTVTEDFKNGLLVVVSKRLNLDYQNILELVDQVILDLKEKNASHSKNEVKPNFVEQFASDIENAHYLAVITSKPLEIELPDKGAFPPLRRYLFNDLISRLYDPNKDLKYYRFNFPTSSYGSLFWRGLKRILTRHFKNNPTQHLFDSLYHKFTIKTDTWVNVTQPDSITEELIEKIVDETLEQLNRNRYILIFTTTAPVYSLPLIVMEPSDNRNIKVYAMLEMEIDKLHLFRFPDNDALLWRLFVWDQLKAKKYAGEEVKYSSTL